jgi:hypothetical protein
VTSPAGASNVKRHVSPGTERGSSAAEHVKVAASNRDANWTLIIR